MTAPVILVEASPRSAADGSTVPVLLAGGGAKVPYAYGGQTGWRAGVTGLPTFIASLEFEGGDFPAGSVPSATEIRWAPSRKADLAAMAALMWIDAPIVVRIGAEGSSLPAIAISGTVLEATVDGGALRIVLSDPAAALKKPLLTARFAGTGGLEGPVEWAGLIRRRIWGRVRNLRADPIDKANNIYCLADPLKPIQSIDAVRDKGAAAASLTTLAWAGSAAATFAALQAASAPAGGGVICPSIACIKWWTQPAGDLCADAKGEIGSGYVETAPAIAQALVAAIAGPAFASGTVSAAVTARPAAAGWVAKDDSSTVAAMLDQLLGDSSMLWLLDAAGLIVIRGWYWGTSVAAAKSHEVSRKKVLRPVATRRLGYKRNELPMQRGDIAAAVLVGDVSGLGDLATANRSSLAFGGNAVVNSDFVRGAYGFLIRSSGSTSDGLWSIGINGVNLPSWYGLRNVAYVNVATGGVAWAAGASAYADVICTRGIWSGESVAVQQAFGLPVKAGDRVYFRSLVARHRCAVECYLLVFDKAGTLVETSSLFGGRSLGGANGDPANFDEVGQLYTVTNAAASSAALMWRMWANGGADPYVFITEPAFGVVPAGQTVLPPYISGTADPLADRTADNTAAFIAGQAATATSSDFSVVTGTTKPADNATRNIVTYSSSAPSSPANGDLWVDTSGTFAVFKLRSGGAWQTGANALTAYNALSGKPVALADINTTESSKLTGIETAADVTSSIVGASDVGVAADYTGAITDTLPRVAQFYFIRQGVDLTTSASWSVSVISGTVSASIGAATGLLSLNTSGGTITSSVIEITATYGATTRKTRLSVTVNKALPPNTGANGGSTRSTGFTASVNSTTMTAIGSVLNIVIGSAGGATLSADYSFTMASGSGGLQMQWYWYNGSAWVALGSAVASTDNAIAVDGTPGDGSILYGDSGRTVGSIQQYQLYARTSAGSIARAVSGTETATGS